MAGEKKLSYNFHFTDEPTSYELEIESRKKEESITSGYIN